MPLNYSHVGGIKSKVSQCQLVLALFFSAHAALREVLTHLLLLQLLSSAITFANSLDPHGALRKCLD